MTTYQAARGCRIRVTSRCSIGPSLSQSIAKIRIPVAADSITCDEREYDSQILEVGHICGQFLASGQIDVPVLAEHMGMAARKKCVLRHDLLSSSRKREHGVSQSQKPTGVSMR